jgi:DNA (cytosine-5)-methyltransferase 1
MSCFDQGDTRATTVVAIQERAICENPGAGPDGAGVRADGVSYTLEARTVPQAVAYDITGTLATNGGKETDCHTALRSRPPGQSEASTTTVVAQGFTYSGYSNQPAWMTGDRTDCLPASGHSDGSHQGVGVVAFAQNQLGEVRTNAEVMGTVNTNQNASGRNTPMVQQAMAVRRLTPRECERLQGFPDDYTLVEYRKKPAADGPRYRALGNSMAVPVMRWIGERIKMVDELRSSP